MTIQKAQGQTADKVGIDLSQQVFAHGSLYSALSRVKSHKMFRIYSPNSKRNPTNGNIFVENIVAKGVIFY